MRQQGHKKSHEDLGRLLSGLQTKLSECSAGNAASYEKCIAQQETAEVARKDMGSFCSLLLPFRETSNLTLYLHKVADGSSPKRQHPNRRAEGRMSDAELRRWKRRRTECPMEALAVFATQPRPPDSRHTAESGRVERHYRKCGFHQNLQRGPSSPIIIISPTWCTTCVFCCR